MASVVLFQTPDSPALRRPCAPPFADARSCLPAKWLWRFREAHGLRGRLEGRLAERQRRLRAAHLRGEEDGRAHRPAVRRLSPVLGGGRVGWRLGAGGGPGVRDWAAVADCDSWFRQELAEGLCSFYSVVVWRVLGCVWVKRKERKMPVIVWKINLFRTILCIFLSETQPGPYFIHFEA